MLVAADETRLRISLRRKGWSFTCALADAATSRTRACAHPAVGQSVMTTIRHAESMVPFHPQSVRWPRQSSVHLLGSSSSAQARPTHAHVRPRWMRTSSLRAPRVSSATRQPKPSSSARLVPAASVAPALGVRRRPAVRAEGTQQQPRVRMLTHNVVDCMVTVSSPHRRMRRRSAPHRRAALSVCTRCHRVPPRQVFACLAQAVVCHRRHVVARYRRVERMLTATLHRDACSSRIAVAAAPVRSRL